MSTLVIEDKKYQKKKKEVQAILIRIFLDIGMDLPENINQIVEFCTSDVDDCADKTQWHDGDVIIALRRFIER